MKRWRRYRWVSSASRRISPPWPLCSPATRGGSSPGRAWSSMAGGGGSEMMLLEHGAKTLLGELGLPIPPGTLVRRGDALPLVTEGVVKAQVPVGGRGKAGGIRVARD